MFIVQLSMCLRKLVWVLSMVIYQKGFFYLNKVFYYVFLELEQEVKINNGGEYVYYIGNFY